MRGVLVLLLGGLGWASPQDFEKEHFSLVTYAEFIELKAKLEASDLVDVSVRVSDAFSLLPRAKPPQCATTSAPCVSPLIELGDFETGVKTLAATPTVLIIAGFHGDEVVGTNAIYRLLQSFLRVHRSRGWLHALLKHTRVVFLPMANTNGFDAQQRLETTPAGLLDPNRDFPYDLSAGTGCFKTSTAAVIDRIFRKYLVIGALTFHGGDNSISFPWGNFAHEEDPVTEDDVAFRLIAEALKAAGHGSHVHDIEDYRTGLMQTMVYDVNGGFEDWAYGASWDAPNVPKSCGAEALYSFDAVSYDRESNRALVYLVEASYQKTPSADTLGNELSLFYPEDEAADWGHVSRNVNLILAFAAMINPFLELQRLEFVPAQRRLLVELRAEGCLKIYRAYASDPGLVLVSPLGGKTLTFCAYNAQAAYRSVHFSVSCDEELSSSFAKKAGRTHFANYRTKTHYYASSGENELYSHAVVGLWIFNVQTERLQQAVGVYAASGAVTLAYSAAKHSVIVAGSPKYLISYSEGVAAVTDLAGDAHYKAEIDQFACEPFGRQILEVNLSSPQPLTKEKFVELIGRSVVVHVNGQSERGVIVSESDALLVPTAGLVNFSTEGEKPFVIVDMLNQRSHFEGVEVTVVSSARLSKVRLSSIKYHLKKQIGSSVVNQLVYKAFIPGNDSEQLLLLSRKLELYNDGDVLHQSVYLGRKSPAFVMQL